MENYKVIIIGGGTAGITVAAQLLRKQSDLKLGIIEPSKFMHTAPPQSAPDFIKESSLAMADDPYGWGELSVA